MENPDILNPTVFIGSFEFREPITALTDLASSMASFVGVFYLHRFRDRATESFSLYRNFFLFFGLSMFSAAVLGHGLQAYVGPEWKTLGWVFNAIAQMNLAFAALHECRNLITPKWKHVINYVNLLEFVVFLFLMTHPVTRTFEVAQTSTALFLLTLTFPLFVLHYLATRHSGSAIILGAIAYGLVPAWIYNQQISVSRWFNFHDISHVLVCIYMIVMVVGTSRLALTKKDTLTV